MLIDVISISLLIMAVIKGMNKGLIVAVFSFAALFIGMVAALKLSAAVAHQLHQSMNLSGFWLPAFSFTLVFAVVVFCVKIGAGTIKKIARIVFLGWLDALLGILLYASIYMILFSVLLFFSDRINIISDETKNVSKTYSYISPVGPKVVNNIGKVLPFLNGIIGDLNSYFDTVAKKHSS